MVVYQNYQAVDKTLNLDHFMGGAADLLAVKQPRKGGEVKLPCNATFLIYCNQVPPATLASGGKLHVAEFHKQFVPTAAGEARMLARVKASGVEYLRLLVMLGGSSRATAAWALPTLHTHRATQGLTITRGETFVRYVLERVVPLTHQEWLGWGEQGLSAKSLVDDFLAMKGLTLTTFSYKAAYAALDEHAPGVRHASRVRGERQWLKARLKVQPEPDDARVGDAQQSSQSLDAAANPAPPLRSVSDDIDDVICAVRAQLRAAASRIGGHTMHTVDDGRVAVFSGGADGGKWHLSLDRTTHTVDAQEVEDDMSLHEEALPVFFRLSQETVRSFDWVSAMVKVVEEENHVGAVAFLSHGSRYDYSYYTSFYDTDGYFEVSCDTVQLKKKKRRWRTAPRLHKRRRCV
jgi:hypothetical protein